MGTSKAKNSAHKATPESHGILKQLLPLKVPLDKLVLDPENPREHSADSISAIRESLLQFGQDVPLVVQKQGMVVRKGNGRVMAMRELGWTHCAAIIVDEGDVHAAARAVVDNRTAEFSVWNHDVLSAVMKRLEPGAEQLSEQTRSMLRALGSKAVESKIRGLTSDARPADESQTPAEPEPVSQYRPFSASFTVAQDDVFRAAIREAKRHGAGTVGDALFLIAKEWMEWKESSRSQPEGLSKAST